MGLTKQGLLEHKRRLEEVIEHSKRELSAVNVLLEGFELRANGDHPAEESDTNNGMTLKDMIANVVEHYPHAKFTAGDICQGLVDRGFKKRSDWDSYRPTVSHVLRVMAERGQLSRTNAGESGTKKFVYQKTQKGFL